LPAYQKGVDQEREQDRHLSASNVTAAWPVEIRLAKDRRALHVTFDDGKAFSLSAVTILSVDPVGNYAVRLGFDDMHTTGIYSWAFLRDLGMNAEPRFQDYLDDLQAKGLDRDKPGMR
jgi:DUF971 family protein